MTCDNNNDDDDDDDDDSSIKMTDLTCRKQ